MNKKLRENGSFHRIEEEKSLDRLLVCCHGFLLVTKFFKIVAATSRCVRETQGT